jgi:hypothetical protein
MEIRWTGCVRKEEELLSQGGDEYPTNNKKNED